jgi:hypothetical protein
MDIDTVNNAVNQAFTSSNPGGVGTSYGQANGGLISQAAADHPDVTSALANGTASLGYNADTGQSTLINTRTGQEIQGNYTVTSTPAGGVAVNLPLSNGAMVQVASGVGQNGQIAPVSASNVYNVGLNAGAGGFAGGINDLKPLLTKAALLYAGSQFGGAADTAAPGTTLSDLNTGVNYGGIGDTTGLGGTDYSLGGTGSTGQGLNVAQGAGTNLFDTTAVNPATGLSNGLGLQASGSANLASMGGGQGLTIPTSTGASTVPNAVLGAGGTTNYGTNNFGGVTPTTVGGTANTTGTTGTTGVTGTTTAPLGSTLATVNTGITGAGALNNAANTATNALGLTPLQTGLLGSTALNALGSSKTSNAISNAAATQAQAGQNVQDALSGFYNQYAQAQQPYQNLGSGAVQAITQGAPYFTHQFGPEDLKAGLAPNYDFMLAQGQRANQNAANVGGGLLSGNTLQGMQNYTQNYAQNAYQNAFNNYQTQRQNIYGNLSNAAGLGQTSLGQLGQVGASLGQTYGNVTTGLAASQAGAQTAQAVNQANLLSNLGNAALVSSIAGTPGTNFNVKLA